MEVVMTQPRGFCAGVVRAIEIVESALEIYGAPVYVVHEIVHNQRVVEDLRSRGAVFVETLDEVPPDAVTVFSAHGVSEQMINNAQARGLNVINATCPLVTKVHLEVIRNAKAGNEVVLIGHAGHPEVNGTLGHFDRGFGGEIYLVQDEKDVAALHVKNPSRLTYVTQTTLSVDDTRVIVAALKRRFPEINEPKRDDICYATQNRQSAVRKLMNQVDLLIVVGARNSSNSNRLREVGEQMGVNSFLVEDADDLDLSWFSSDLRVGITAGASTPEVLVQEVLRKLGSLGVNKVVEMDAEPERVTFRLPAGLTSKLNRNTKNHVETL